MGSASFHSIHDVKSIQPGEITKGISGYYRTFKIFQNTSAGGGEHEVDITLFAEKKEDLEFLKEA